MTSAADVQIPAIQAFDHVQVAVDDLESARKFYVRYFGLTELRRPDFPVAGAWLRGPNLQLHLVEVDTPLPSIPGVPHVAVRLSREDFRPFVDALRAEGVPFVFEPASREDFGVEVLNAFVKDPAGNHIELVSGPGPA